MVIFNKNISEEIVDISRRIYSWYKSGILLNKVDFYKWQGRP